MRIVWSDGSYSETVLSRLGILTDDSISPLLWILYMHDFNPPEREDDVVLNSRRVFHLEQVDDIVLFSLFLIGLQLNIYYSIMWCAKTLWSSVSRKASQ